METKIAVIWARVSDPKQEELSPEGQVERVKTKLDSLGWIMPPDNILKTTWTSTDLKPCPEFQKLLKLIREKKIQAVGMLDRDRIEAYGLQRLNFFAECKENGVEVIVCQGPSFIDGPEGQLVELALALSKEKQVQRAQSGAKQGLSDRATLKGLPPTKAKVYGMTWPKNEFGKYKANGGYIHNDDYDNASLIFDLWFERCNLNHVCRELTNRGIKTSMGRNTWLPSSVIAILKNPIYAGRVATLKYEKVEPQKRLKQTFGKTSRRIKPESEWHWLDGLVEKPIITWEQHVAILEKLKLNKANASRNAKHNYLAKGIIECMLCGRHYYGVKYSSNGKRNYVCSNHWAVPAYRDKCSAKPIDCDALENDIRAKVRSFLEQPDVFLPQADNNIHQYNDNKEDIQNYIKDLDRQRRRTIDDEAKALRLLSEEAFQSEQKLLMGRRLWLSEELERQQQKLTDLTKLEVNRDKVIELKQRLQNNLDNATPEDWRFIIDTLGLKVLSFGDGTWEIEVSVPASESLIANNTALYIHRVW